MNVLYKLLRLKNLVTTAFVILFTVNAYGEVVAPEVNATVSPEREKAALIYRRLAGVKVPIDAPELKQMEALIKSGDTMGAAKVATQNKNFYDITVRHFAARMSNRDETFKAPLTDFVATVVGSVRDGLNAKQLLYGDYYYIADPNQAGNVRANLKDDILLSNNHYLDIEAGNFSLFDVLTRQDGQMVLNRGDANGAPTKNPDPAGLITSRSFTEAHAVAGTNRRMVHYTFKMFLCIDMEQWADTSSPDNRVGPDVDRAPGGDPSIYLTKCKGCHGNMDNLRGAFANIDFSNNYLKHGLVMTNRERPDTDNENEFNGTNAIHWKYKRNNNIFAGGFSTVDNSWVNNAVAGTNASFFGWRGTLQGSGINSYGRMIANSEAFSRCMAKRVYRQVCKREVSQFETGVIADLAKDFEINSYNLKSLFEKVAINKACIGE